MIANTVVEQEQWLPVAGYEGRYEVSNLGGVRSLARSARFGCGTRLVAGRTIYQHRAARNGVPYMQVTLWIGTRGKTFKVHHLVLNAFIGARPVGMQCRHLDGDSTRNHVGNLAWGTSAENIADRTAHGRHDVKGSANPRSRLCAEQVLAIRASEATQQVLADLFGVTKTTIRHIQKGATWTHLLTN